MKRGPPYRVREINLNPTERIVQRSSKVNRLKAQDDIIYLGKLPGLELLGTWKQ
jgi:hypothetical protein